IRNYQMNEYFFLKKRIKLKFFYTILFNNKILNVILFPYLCVKFLFIVKKYDLVHLHVSSFGSFARKNLLSKFCLLSRRSYIIHLHGSEFKKFYQASDKRKKLKISKFFNNAEKVIVLGEKWKEFIDSLVENKERVIVLNNAVSQPKIENNIVTSVKKNS